MKLGRCNDEGPPVFYFSDSEETAVIEKQPQEGDILTVLTCELADPTRMPNVVSIGVHEFTAKSNPNYGGVPPEHDIKQQALLRKEGLSKVTPLIEGYLIKEFLKEVPDDEQFQYITTSIIASLLFEKPETVTDEGDVVRGVAIDGIAYPSIRCDMLGANVALKTDSADKLYLPTSCMTYRVEKANPKYPYTVGTLCWSSSIQNGKIDWHIPKPDESKELGFAST